MQHPDCHHDPSECVISAVSSVKQPLIEWAPIYNGAGEMTNSDPNTFIQTSTCTMCNMTWETSTTGGTTTIGERTPVSAPQ